MGKKKMSAALKGFLKRHGRFPKKGELRSRVIHHAAGTKKRRVSHTTKHKKSTGNKRMGIVPWAINAVSLGVGLSNVFARISDANNMSTNLGEKLEWFGRYLMYDMTGLNTARTGDYWDFDYNRLIRGWGPIITSYVVNKGLKATVGKMSRNMTLLPDLKSVPIIGGLVS